ncbi:hypothetical protein OOK29_09600 [Streptomyces phaeochromogenes]|uniref:hypothetical protein n=1 Tax=Streptomyces phaeochromogenes TaxID=1923 RepID=UPI00224CECF3|nr:hypothetical protein [Streptomyces phaeochromogenes]MCX5598391.1 hypothetical protein [Streptomyces phaeochromogenes]
MQKLRGYWEDLPAESPNRRRYGPPDEPSVQPVVALVAVIAGIAIAVSGAVLAGVGIAVAGLVWGAVMQRQVAEYRVELAVYNASVICLAEYYVFA